MRWRLHPSRGDAPTPAEDEAEALPRPGGVHRSPGLPAALVQVGGERSSRVLDLGPAMEANVAFFARFRCRLEVVDLLSLRAPAPAGGPEALIDTLLPAAGGEFDLVLAWDVFDHLEEGPARALATRLARLCRWDARLFALTATTRGAPSSPHLFAILDRETLDYRAAPGGRATSRAAINPAAFEQLLEGFRIDGSFVLRHGMHEWVAIRTAGSFDAPGSLRLGLARTIHQPSATARDAPQSAALS